MNRSITRSTYVDNRSHGDMSSYQEDRIKALVARVKELEKVNALLVQSNDALITEFLNDTILRELVGAQ